MTRFKSLKVKDIMTDAVHSISVPGHRNNALKIMKEQDISGLPVVEKKTNKFLGIITRRDIYEKPDKEQLAMLYEENVVTISPNSYVLTVVKRFIETGQYWLPVVEDDVLKGIITPADLLGSVEDFGKDRSVMEFIGKKNCMPIYKKSPLSVALNTLLITQAPALPVLDEKARLVGIVSDLDIFRTLESERTKRNFELNVEDDDWTWEGIRNFHQIYSIPEMHLPDLKVENVMVKNVKYLYPHSLFSEAAHTMRVNNIGQLPICKKDDILVGMVYNYDILSVLLQNG